jgi:hypothetical protein
MKKFLLLSLMAIFLLNLIGRSETVLSIDPISFTVSAGKGETYFSVTSNVDWRVSSTEMWAVPEKISDNLIKVKYYETLATTSRQTYIEVTGGGKTVSSVLIQEGAKPYVSVGPKTEFNLGYGSGEIKLQVYSNTGSWHYDLLGPFPPDWISVLKPTNENYAFYIFYEENNTDEVRNYEFYITAEGAESVLITISQRARGPANLRITGGETTIEGSVINLYLEVSNVGQRESDYTYVDAYLSLVSGINSLYSYFMDSELCPRLQPDETTSITLKADAQYIAAPPGSYYIICVVDEDDYVIEEREDDNGWLSDEKYIFKEICTDPLEPNNTIESAHLINSLAYQNYLCLKDDDEDWFAFNYGGKMYFFVIKESLFSYNYNYTLDFSINSIGFLEILLSLEFDDSVVDVELSLYDSNLSLLDRSTEEESEEVYLNYLLPEGNTPIQESYANDEEFIILPNPVKDFLIIKSNQKLYPSEICIYNTLGYMVFQENDFSGKKLNLSALEPGVYVLNFHLNDKIITKKIIKE